MKTHWTEEFLTPTHGTNLPLSAFCITSTKSWEELVNIEQKYIYTWRIEKSQHRLRKQQHYPFYLSMSYGFGPKRRNRSMDIPFIFLSEFHNSGDIFVQFSRQKCSALNVDSYLVYNIMVNVKCTKCIFASQHFFWYFFPNIFKSDNTFWQK